MDKKTLVEIEKRVNHLIKGLDRDNNAYRFGLAVLNEIEVMVHDTPTESIAEEPLEEAKQVIQDLLDSFDIPEPSCTCHLSPPCGDCVDYSVVREVVAKARQYLKSLPDREAK